MKVSLVIFFDYENKPDKSRDEAVSGLLKSFAAFCDDACFDFQCIPRIGERIVAESLIRKWVENKNYIKPCSDSQIWNTFYCVILKTGSFTVEEIYHSTDTCTIFCSDIAYEDIE